MLRFCAIALAVVGGWLLLDEVVAAFTGDRVSGLQVLIGLVALVGGLVLLQMQKKRRA